MQEETGKILKYQKEIRCPVHNKLIGKYDSRIGVINVTYYCSKCKREYVFTIKKDRNVT